LGCLLASNIIVLCGKFGKKKRRGLKDVVAVGTQEKKVVFFFIFFVAFSVRCFMWQFPHGEGI